MHLTPAVSEGVQVLDHLVLPAGLLCSFQPGEQQAFRVEGCMAILSMVACLLVALVRTGKPKSRRVAALCISRNLYLKA